MGTIQPLLTWLASIGLCILWLLITTANFSVLLRGGSMIPFIGGVSGAIGLYISPLDSLERFVWVPALLDPGSFFYIIVFCIAMISERLKQ